jgi:predicted phage terminase large subunit-like protein
MRLKRFANGSMKNINTNRRRMIKHLCETSFLHYARYIFKRQTNQRLIIAPYHHIICDTLQAVEQGAIKRLIINIPPSYTKTELAVVSFISHGLAINPRSKFIHTSYSDSLALNNSSRIKEIIEADWYQRYWPTVLRHDTQSKSLWSNSLRGGLYAVSAGGAITGFHAGRIYDSNEVAEYAGAIVIDDPIKANDAYSRVIRERRNNWINNTVKSRTATPDVPIILIMQRIHDEDPTGFLLRGGTGDIWHHLCIPANYTKTEYPAEYTHGIPIECNLNDGPIWPYKHDETALNAMRDADKYTYSSQYMQRPSPQGGSLFEIKGLQYYEKYNKDTAQIQYRSGDTVNIRSSYMFCDTAHKKGQENDYTVFSLYGLGADKRIYLLDMVRDKMTAPELKRAFIAFLSKWTIDNGNTLAPREVLIEDKASGIGLIQEIREDVKANKIRAVKILGIPRNVDKISRANSSAPSVANGKVVFPAFASYTRELVRELEDFSPTMTHRHDDQVDTMMDAIQYLLQSETPLAYRSLI